MVQLARYYLGMAREIYSWSSRQAVRPVKEEVSESRHLHAVPQ